MICFWNFHKHNKLKIGLLTHCLWFRSSAMEGAGGSAHGWETSLHRLENVGDIMAARFRDKMSKFFLYWDTLLWCGLCHGWHGSSLHTLDSLQRHDLWKFPFQHLTLSVDIQVSQELTVWCITLEILSKLQPSVCKCNMCKRHAVFSEKRHFHIYVCTLDLTFAQQSLNSANVLDGHSACIFTTIFWKSLIMSTCLST